MFNVVFCPICSGTLMLDSSLTISQYSKDYTEKYKILTIGEPPPELFNYMIFKCQNKKCSIEKKYSHQEILTLVSKKWADIAWRSWQKSMSRGVNFEQYFTRYLIDNKFKLDVAEIEKYNNNNIIRDILKHGKSS